MLRTTTTTTAAAITFEAAKVTLATATASRKQAEATLKVAMAAKGTTIQIVKEAEIRLGEEKAEQATARTTYAQAFRARDAANVRLRTLRQEAHRSENLRVANTTKEFRESADPTLRALSRAMAAK